MKKAGGDLIIRNTSKSEAVVDIVIPASHVLYRQTPIILLEDDKYLRMSWSKTAAYKKFELVLFSSIKEFRECIPQLDIQSEVFIDSHLGDESGEDFLEELIAKGFNKINFATGKSIDDLKSLNGVNNVVGKAFPY